MNIALHMTSHATLKTDYRSADGTDWNVGRVSMATRPWETKKRSGASSQRMEEEGDGGITLVHRGRVQ